MERIALVESGKNPFAIGVVGGKLVRQPKSAAEAIATAKALDVAGWNFSLGVGQVNKFNLARFNLDFHSVFDPCNNLRAGAAILAECDLRARKQFSGKEAIDAAHSCYYSGNFTRGQQPDTPGGTSYVQRIDKAPASLSDLSEAVPIEVIRTTAKAPQSVQMVSNTLQEPETTASKRSAETSSNLSSEISAKPAPAPAKWDVLGDFSSQPQTKR